MKLGSLFDGSGGFPLAGVLCGIEPVWASEVEPFCIRVTRERFPQMEHLGDVTQVDGAMVEPVDIITFGSPCQDLSVAGKQAGIHDGTRSSLFFEAIRIIREMRDATENKFPRFAVWENVPGAFSSHKGEDFRAVLQAFCSIRGGYDHIVPQPPKGKWNHAGCIVGDGWSIAWRLYDAQFWGVPQRRKRIYLVADFGSERAGEILFKPEGLPGHPAESGAAGQGSAGDAPGSIRGGALAFAWANSAGAGLSEAETAPTIKANRNGEPGVAYSIEGHVIDRNSGQNGRGWAEGYAHTLNATDRHAVALEVYDCRGNGDGKTVCTLSGDHMNRVGDFAPVVTYVQPSFGEYKESDKAQSLKATDGKRTDPGALVIGNGQSNQSIGTVAGTLNCMHDQQAVLTKGKPPRKYIVRRLTPMECGRLQGFPDWWVDGANGSDSAIYRMWGNGIALPCAYDCVSRLADEMRRSEST